MLFKAEETVFFIANNKVYEGIVTEVGFPYCFVKSETLTKETGRNGLLYLSESELYHHKQNAIVDCISLVNISLTLIERNLKILLDDKKARLKHKKEMIKEYHKLSGVEYDE